MKLNVAVCLLCLLGAGTRAGAQTEHVAPPPPPVMSIDALPAVPEKPNANGRLLPAPPPPPAVASHPRPAVPAVKPAKVASPELPPLLLPAKRMAVPVTPDTPPLPEERA